jgi:hypothetical protein
MRHEECGEPFLEERVERPERLGRGARRELDELRRLVEADQRVRKAVWRLAELGGQTVSLELALRGEQHVDEGCGDRPEHEEHRPLEPAADSAQLDRRGGEDDDHGLQCDVAVLHMGQLVREHALELSRRARGEEA